MNEILIDLSISPDEYLKHYQMPGININARSVDGRRVRLPANIFQQYVTREGIKGRFRIIFSQTGKFQRIERL